MTTESRVRCWLGGDLSKGGHVPGLDEVLGMFMEDPTPYTCYFRYYAGLCKDTSSNGPCLPAITRTPWPLETATR